LNISRKAILSAFYQGVINTDYFTLVVHKRIIVYGF
jgi:hypothetical protein